MRWMCKVNLTITRSDISGYIIGVYAYESAKQQVFPKKRKVN
jgi:hypothetical protein